VPLRVVERAGIYSALEQALETLVDRAFAQCAAIEGEETECGEMTFVKNERMSERYRPGSIGRVIDESKQPSRALPITSVPVDEGSAVRDRARNDRLHR
jgi:hypothetical protein